MLNATVIGTATSTIKHAALQGQKLLLVQPWLTDGVTPDGEPLLAIDPHGSAVGQTVVITSDGKFVRELIEEPNPPIRWAVLGIQDEEISSNE